VASADHRAAAGVASGDAGGGAPRNPEYPGPGGCFSSAVTETTPACYGVGGHVAEVAFEDVTKVYADGTKAVDDLETGLWPVGHRDGDRTVQLHDR